MTYKIKQRKSMEVDKCQDVFHLTQWSLIQN